MRTALLLVVLVAACEGPEAHVPDGTWVHEEGDCALGLTTKGGSYVAQTMCFLQGRAMTAGDEVEKGSLESTDKQIKFVPREASCPTSDHSETLYNYTLSGGSLALSDSAGVIVFKPVPLGPPSGTPTILLGCWTMGQFTEHAIQSL